MKKLMKMNNRFVIALMLLFLMTITYTAYSLMSGSRLTSSFRYRTNGMNYLIVENNRGGVAVINLTKDATETEYYKTMTIILQSK